MSNLTNKSIYKMVEGNLNKVEWKEEGQDEEEEEGDGSAPVAPRERQPPRQNLHK